MRQLTRALTASLLLGPDVVWAALNLDGTQAAAPAGDGDPSPISDPHAYDPNQHDCPLPCVDYSNIHSWTPYLSVDRLRRCQEPMLLQFSVTQPLDDPASTILIRSCALNVTSRQNLGIASPGSPRTIENPKKSEKLFDPKLNSAPACHGATAEVKGATLQLAATTGNDSGGSPDDVVSLLEGMGRFFDAKDNCDENFLFAWHKKTAASVYLGAALGKPTVASAVRALASRLQTGRSVPNRTIAELCGSGRRPEHLFGIAIGAAGDLATLQSTALAWSHGACAADGNMNLEPAGELKGARVFEVKGAPMLGGGNDNNNRTVGRNSITASIYSIARLTPRSWPIHAPGKQMQKRATCRYIHVVSGDSCGTLVSRCGISAADFYKYNPAANLCGTLMPDDYVCCSAGDPYKPPTPQPDLDGTCATHLIQNGDTCETLAKRYHVTVSELEAWNRGKTWGWTECRDMLLGYNMCISDGFAPLPPPQEGASCGPLVPGTQFPPDFDRWRNALGELNPCPLKACCSNWGFCGPFPAHCEIHAPEGGGPGSKEKGYQSTCVSNCGTDIKVNSGPPAAFQRIGYYESYNMKRECLWLGSKRANTDGTYTHIHWAFAEIDPNGWNVVLTDPYNQWADFKALPNVKRILAFGGWAYSTELATFGIIRAAILDHGAEFASNIAKFLNDEGLDGVDIDWEYPGAPDIYVGDQPIGQKGDGAGYLTFLTALKKRVGPSKSVSIAAPASFWYLKAFPIDRIAAVIDYIVFMTYDLHGQWDYGNANAFDACESGKCIRSHVNLTETRSSLSIITKAGVPNNKIFVGEASFGRTFHMAQDGCWGPMCEFTGTRLQSDANPGRCTKTAGYLGYAEILEIVSRSGDNVQAFHDHASNTDVLLYKGDYVSYMTPTSRDTRRADWQKLNFAGTVDWAVDLQLFGEEDKAVPPTLPNPGEEGCITGEDLTANTAELCEFACAYGFCPPTLCRCTDTGRVPPFPPESKGVNISNIIAWDEDDVELNQLCKFGCKYSYCPSSACTTPIVDVDTGDDPEDDMNDPNYVDTGDIRYQNQKYCYLSQDPREWGPAVAQCKNWCTPYIEQAADEGRTTNYGCVVWQPKGAPDPYQPISGMPGKWAKGECNCDNFLINEIADTVLEAMPAIAQIACYVVMSSFKLVLDVGTSLATGGASRVLSGGLDMLATAAEMASYIYPANEDPAGAFSWWLSPCGGMDLVPDDIKKVFDILNSLPDGVSSFRVPKNIPKGSGRKGDSGNPHDQSTPRAPGPIGGGGSKPKCRVPVSKQTQRLMPAKNTVRVMECVRDRTKTTEYVVTSVISAQNAVPSQVKRRCLAAWTQACYHYSSAISVNNQWATLTCPPEAGRASKQRDDDSPAMETWAAEHKGAGWKDTGCDRDEFPPAYLLNDQMHEWRQGGKQSDAQLIRLLPNKENQGAGGMWKGACFREPLLDLSDRTFKDKVVLANVNNPRVLVQNADKTQTFAAITVDQWPEFTITAWDHAANPPNDDGLWDNRCWPQGRTPNDPGFALLQEADPWNKAHWPNGPPWQYAAKYEAGKNGV